MQTPPAPAPADPEHPPAPVDIAEESIAGEEDPGASLDLGIVPPPRARDPDAKAPPPESP